MSFRFDIPNFLLLISILANTYLFLVVFFNGAKNPSRRYFQGMIFGVIGWALGMFMYRGVTSDFSVMIWTKFIYVVSATIPLFFLLFALSFPNFAVPKNKKYLWYSLLASLPFITLPLADKKFITQVIIHRQVENDIFFNWTVYVWGAYMIIYLSTAFGILIKRYIKSAGIVRLQLKYIIIGCLLPAVMGVIINIILLSALEVNSFSWIGQFSTIIMTALVTYAITNYKLMGIKFFIRRSLVVFAAVFTIVVLWYSGYRVIMAYTENNIAFNVFFVALTPLLYVKLKNVYFDLANRYFFASLYDVHLLIKEINDKLWHLYSIQKIGGALRAIFKEIFHVENLAIIEVDKSGNRLEAVFDNGFDLNDRSLFEAGNIQSIFKKKTPEPILVEEFVNRHWLSAEMEAAVDWLQAVKPAVVAPLISDGRVSGLLLVGAKASEDVFSREDIQVIRETAKSVSLAVGIARRDEERERELKEMKEFVANLNCKI